jgi:phosphoglycolate phosphatase-like HAD superfamily hydrolase
MAKVFVFDIDGTLADLTHRRNYVASKPKNWSAFDAAIPFDKPFKDIIFLLNMCLQLNHKVVLCSGRSERTRVVTENWLRENEVQYAQLYMRTDNDHRQDFIVKVELLEQIREQHGEPFIWFDDRQQVVDAIRAQGVRVLQVAPGDF